MASIESGRHHYHHQQQQQQQQHHVHHYNQQNQQQQRYNNANGSYSQHPDQSSSSSSSRTRQQQQQQQHQHQDYSDHKDYSHLTPQSSVSSTSSRNPPTPGRANSRDNNVTRAGSGQSPRPQHAQPKLQQSNLSYLKSPASSSSNNPPSPISPSSPSPLKAITGQLNLTHLNEPVVDRVSFENYDQSQYQQPRKKTPTPAQQQQQQHRQPPQRQQSFDTHGGPSSSSTSSGGLKQSGSSASARSVTTATKQHYENQPQVGNGTLRQSPSAGSAYHQHQLTPSHSNGSAASSGPSSRHHRQGSPASSSPLDQEREHFPANQSHSSQNKTRQQQPHQDQQHHHHHHHHQNNGHLNHLHYDSDENDEHDERGQELHRQQALEYQKKLQQKPPSAYGDDDSDDSDSGSMLSYRRSISRLSISYKRPNAGPNISLFAPGQRPAMLHAGGNSLELSNSQKMIKDQREERLRQQQQRQNNASASSLASIDQQSRHDDSGRPMGKMSNRPIQGNVGNGREIDIPVRSTSAENMFSGNNAMSRPHQGQGQSQGAYPGGSNNGRGPHHHQQQQQHHANNLTPRHYQENGGHSPRSKPATLNLSPNDYPQRGDSQDHTRAKSPARGPGSPLPGAFGSSAGGYRQNGPLPSRGAPSPSPSGGYNMNPHPAHHLPSGGYVRPEEAVGPSNPMPEKAEDFVRQGIEYHEVGDIAKATHFFRTAAELGDPVGMLMYGLSVRHGWGCGQNRQLAFQYLQKSAEHAVGDLKSRDSFANTAAKGELVLAIYELGMCFRHGWGVDKNKKTAAYYFEIAANLGDPDAQNDLAWCYYHGEGVKKDMFKSAKYYRLAAAQGLNTVGNSWIWKDKYGGVPASPTGEKHGAGSPF
ncbi:hypothetical protein BGZ94_000522 [Podila epigama]|nr:hypothetical protein BGZ94_000522 [Podila epigama]